MADCILTGRLIPAAVPVPHFHPYPSNPSPSNVSSSMSSNGKACRFCSRVFAKTEHLIRHERCHTKERPFQCNICGKNYSRK